MKAVFTIEEDKIFRLGPTRVGRAYVALERLVAVAAVLIIGGGIFFLPDYIGRYREQEPMPGFLLGALVIAALFIGLLTATLRFLRGEVWAVDLDDKMLVYQTKTYLGGGHDQVGIELDRVERFRVDEGSFPRSSGLWVDLDGGISERVFEARAGGESFVEAAEELDDFLKKHRVDIAVEGIEA